MHFTSHEKESVHGREIEGGEGEEREEINKPFAKLTIQNEKIARPENLMKTQKLLNLGYTKFANL